MKAGESVTLNVTAANVAGINFLKLRVLYDQDVLSIENIESLISDVQFVQGENPAVSPAILVWANAGNFDANGVIAKITFKVNDAAAAGETELTLAVDEAFDEADTSVEFEVSGATLNISEADPPEPEVVYGDSNGDGIIDLKDVTLVLQYLAEWDNIEMVDANADANGDGEIDLKDVTLVLQYLAEWDIELGPDAE